MKKPLIGITGNERPNPEDEFAIMSYAAKGFVEGVKEVGGTPIILPIGDADMARGYIQMIDKLILTGGQNVSPQFYGEEKTIDSDDYHLERDLFELALIHEAIQQQKPIFTVCRGTQLFNVAMGGTLYQDIEHHWQDSSAEYTTQKLVTKSGSVLEKIYGEVSHINSFHHQSIKDLAEKKSLPVIRKITPLKPLQQLMKSLIWESSGIQNSYLKHVLKIECCLTMLSIDFKSSLFLRDNYNNLSLRR